SFTETGRGYSEAAGGGKTYEGTLIVISHDRMLLDQVVDQLIVFDGHGRVPLFPGPYSEYLAATPAGGAATLVDTEAPREKPAAKTQAKPQTQKKSGGDNGKAKRGGTRFSSLSQE